MIIQINNIIIKYSTNTNTTYDTSIINMTKINKKRKDLTDTVQNLIF